MSSIQMPSALAMALRQGVDTDWCRKPVASRARRARVGSSRAPACQRARRSVMLVSPSDSAMRAPDVTASGLEWTLTSALPPPLQALEDEGVEREMQELGGDGR